MSRFARMGGGLVTLLVALAGRPAAAQQHAPASASNEIDIMAHLGNSHSIELPTWKAPYYREVELPRFAPLHIAGLTVDLSPTKHAVRSEEHTSELQSLAYLVCRLLLEKKKL